MLNLNKVLFKTISSGKLRNYFNNELNKSLNDNNLKYDEIRKIFHKEINYIDLYGENKLDAQKNLEHVFPKSCFKHDANKEIMNNDMHNLYLCNSKLNNHRGNFKYVDIDNYKSSKGEVYFDTDGNILNNTREIFKNQGCILAVNKSKKMVIPCDYSKGKIARSLAYFCIKYDYLKEIQQIIDIDTMIKWCLNDPVDNEEYLKNILCYKYQNNYNPFILEPELIIYCFCDITNFSYEEILLQKKTKSIDYLKTIEYLINENKSNYEEIKSLHDKIKGLENEILIFYK